MGTPFSRTLRAMEADGLGRPLGRSALGGILLAIGLLWSCAGRVAVHVGAEAARIEVDAEAHVVQVDADGLVVEVLARVGQQLRAGDPLLALEATEARATLAAVEARIRSLELQRAGLVDQLARAGDADEAGGLASAAALAEARAHLAEAEAARAIALSESERVISLLGAGAAAPAEADQLAATATERAAAREAAARRVELLSWDGRLNADERETRKALLAREIVALDAAVAVAGAERALAEGALARRSVVAPIGGVVAEQAALRPGAVLRRGEAVASIVPSGDLKVVARFRPGAAIGRVREGQPATIRLEGFSWIEHGAIGATVRSVGAEPRDGLVRVDLALDGAPSTIPLQHGLPGVVHVEVERVAPARLLLRAIGSRLAR